MHGIDDGAAGDVDLKDWMASVQAELSALRRENAELRNEVALLRAPRPAGRPVTGYDEAVTVEGDGAVVPVAGDRRPVSRRGMIAAVAGAAGGVLLGQATPAAAANGDNVRAGWTTTAATSTVVSTSGAVGLKGVTSSVGGSGVEGRVTATSGENVGVWGSAASARGIGVFAENDGDAGATGGYAVWAEGRLKATGRTFLGTPATAPADSDLNLGSISFYLDPKDAKLKVRVKYPNGVPRSEAIALT